MVQKQRFSVLNFFQPDPMVISNALFRGMLQKIGHKKEGIRKAMNKTRTGNIVCDRSPEKKFILSQKGS